METHLNQLIQLSFSLIERLPVCGAEEVQEYMEERDRLFHELQHITLTPEQKISLRPLVLKIQEQDVVIVGRMEQLRSEANRELGKLEQTKRSRSVYESSAYGDDSLFFDAKR